MRNTIQIAFNNQMAINGTWRRATLERSMAHWNLTKEVTSVQAPKRRLISGVTEMRKTIFFIQIST